MNSRYITQREIEALAEVAVASYEWACEWPKAYRAIMEYAADDMGLKLTKAQASTALRVAQAKWHGIGIEVRRNITKL